MATRRHREPMWTLADVLARMPEGGPPARKWRRISSATLTTTAPGRGRINVKLVFRLKNTTSFCGQGCVGTWLYHEHHLAEACGGLWPDSGGGPMSRSQASTCQHRSRGPQAGSVWRSRSFAAAGEGRGEVRGSS